jgi:hypothetical protein
MYLTFVIMHLSVNTHNNSKLALLLKSGESMKSALLAPLDDGISV